jgi:hypothetical protein
VGRLRSELHAERKVISSTKERAQASAKAHHWTICREKRPVVPQRAQESLSATGKLS